MSDLQQMYKTHIVGVNNGDLDVALSVFDDDVEVVTPNGAMTGAQSQRMLGEAFRTAAPDAKIDVVRTFEVGDTIVAEGTYAGTHTGPLQGPAGTIAPTGRRFAFAFCDVLQARDGKFVAHRIYWDNATFLAQLGLMPAA